MTFGASGLGFRYAGAGRDALQAVDLRVEAGTFYCIVGPNGSGKSTLIRVLLGLLPPATGDARIDGRPVAEWPRRELARHVGVVTQGEELVFPIGVRELVTMGRYPHLGPFQALRSGDRDAVARAMDRCEIADLADRSVPTLSGGERQRARLARALAQEPVAYALDEPTAALDIAHEMAIFELLRHLSRGDGATVLVVTHNLNLAARYADRMLVLDRGSVAAEGTPGTVLTRELVERVWRWPVRIVTHEGPGPDTGAPQVVGLAGAE